MSIRVLSLQISPFQVNPPGRTKFEWKSWYPPAQVTYTTDERQATPQIGGVYPLVVVVVGHVHGVLVPTSSDLNDGI